MWSVLGPVNIEYTELTTRRNGFIDTPAWSVKHRVETGESVAQADLNPSLSCRVLLIPPVLSMPQQSKKAVLKRKIRKKKEGRRWKKGKGCQFCSWQFWACCEEQCHRSAALNPSSSLRRAQQGGCLCRLHKRSRKWNKTL